MIYSSTEFGDYRPGQGVTVYPATLDGEPASVVIRERAHEANPILLGFRALPPELRVEYIAEVTDLYTEILDGTLRAEVRLEVEVAHVVHARKVLSRWLGMFG